LDRAADLETCPEYVPGSESLFGHEVARITASLKYSQERGGARTEVLAGTPNVQQTIAQHQAIQFKLTGMACQVEAARLLTHRAARMNDAGESSEIKAGMAKLFAAETARFCAEGRPRIRGGVRNRAHVPPRAAAVDRRGDAEI
jgi:alkylation response protein AidB-like acyl-CoA dehydrogenase